ncbi:MAG TPA: Clp protease N-terminal domain-containing protein [Ktedonobacteraceae bacterium]
MSNRGRFDKFTERSRKVLSLAQEEAQRFQHNYIGTEHLLLGLVREGQGVAAKVLLNLGVELPKVRDAVENIIGRGDRIVLGEIGLTPRSKKVIELAVDEARRLNHHYIGTEHLLLGLVREGEGIAAGVLESFGLNLERVRRETLAVLNKASTFLGPIQEDTSIAGDVEAADQGAAITLGPLQDEDDRIADSSGDPKDRFARFTVRAKRVLSYSQEEAQRFQHNYIGTEHLLLGLVREQGGIAVHVLHNLGVELNKVRSAVEFIIGRGDRIVLGEIGLTPRAKKVIELAADEARLLNHSYIGTEHLLLGLIREGEGIAAGILQSLNVELKQVRQETIRLLKEQ